MLTVKDLEVNYGEVSAIKDITFSVEEGQIVTLIGNNGAGKTTILKTISGLLKPKKGSVNFLGKELTIKNPAEIVSLGVVHIPEGRQIFSELTVMENLAMGGYLYEKKDRLIVEKKLDEVFTYFPWMKEKSRQKQSGGSLSGGEQQMLAIGRALMSEPKLLMLDEPSLGLAPIIVDQVFEVLLDLRKQKKLTLLLVEQNARRALSIADHGYVIEVGRIVIQDTGQNLLKSEEVKHSYLGMRAKNRN